MGRNRCKEHNYAPVQNTTVWSTMHPSVLAFKQYQLVGTTQFLVTLQPKLWSDVKVITKTNLHLVHDGICAQDVVLLLRISLCVLHSPCGLSTGGKADHHKDLTSEEKQGSCFILYHNSVKMIRILFLWWTFSHYKVPPYLAFRFGRRPFSASNFVLHLQIVNIRVSLWRGKVWLRLLSEVELNSAVLHQDMREQRSACQCLLGCPKSHAQRHTIFRKAHLYLFTAFKVLKWWWPSRNVFLSELVTAALTTHPEDPDIAIYKGFYYLQCNSRWHHFHQTSHQSRWTCSFRTSSLFLHIQRRRPPHLKQVKIKYNG